MTTTRGFAQRVASSPPRDSGSSSTRRANAWTTLARLITAHDLAVADDGDALDAPPFHSPHYVLQRSVGGHSNDVCRHHFFDLATVPVSARRKKITLGTIPTVLGALGGSRRRATTAASATGSQE